MRATSLPKTTRALSILSLAALGFGLATVPAAAAPAPVVAQSSESTTDTVSVTGVLQRAIIDTHEGLLNGHRVELPAAQSLRAGTQDHEKVVIGVRVGKTVLPVQDPDGELNSVGTGKTVTLRLDANTADLAEAGVDGTAPLTSANVSALAESAAQPLTVSAVVKTTTTKAAVAPRAHDVYLAMIVPSDLPSGLPTEAQARSTVNAASGYWNSQTFGVVASLQVKGVKQVATPLTTAQLCSATAGAYDIFAIGQQAFPTVNTEISHIINVLPTCAHNIAGVATIGYGLNNGGDVLLHSLAPDILIHELGHNFSLGHSNLELPDQGYFYDYYGFHSPMAGGTYSAVSPALDVAFQNLLGVLPTNQLTTLKASGNVTLAPATNTTGLRGVTFTDPITQRKYFAEYRTGAGRDQGADYNDLDVYNDDLSVNVRYGTGVRVYAIETDEFSIPSVHTIGFKSSGKLDSYGYEYTHLTALRAGESGAGYEGGFKITVTAASATAATLNIELKKSATSIAATAAKSTYGTSAVIPVTFNSSGSTGGVIEAWSGTTKIGSINVPVASGARSLRVPVLKNLGVKTHPVTVKFVGSTTHNASSVNTSVIVARAATSQTVALSNLYYTQAGKVSLVVKSAIAPTGVASVYVDGKLIRKVTVTNGKASFTLPTSLKLGNHTLRVNFAQTGTHNASVVSKAFTVVKKKGVISGFVTGTKSVKTGKTYKDEFTVNHTALVQKKSGSTWKTIKTIPAGKYTLTHKAGRAGTSASYRVVIKGTSAVTGVTSKALVVRSVR